MNRTLIEELGLEPPTRRERSRKHLNKATWDRPKSGRQLSRRRREIENDEAVSDRLLTRDWERHV